MAKARKKRISTKTPGNYQSKSLLPSFLGNQQLLERLYYPTFEDRLVVSPLIDPNTQIQGGAIDLRLGTKFLMTQRAEINLIDPLEVSEDEIMKVLQRVDLPLGSPLVLHPDMLVLASTLEYVALPRDLSASVITRSSYGRIGLLSATAVQVHPGYKGCITLELVNYGETAIRLYPGLRIAQLVLHQVGKSDIPAKQKYHLATEPEYPKFWQEKDRDVLEYLRNNAKKRGLGPISFH